MDGLAVGSTCYREPAEAAAAWCAQVGIIQGIPQQGSSRTPDGSYSVCNSAVYEYGHVAWLQETVIGTQASYQYHNQVLPPCEVYDLATLQPVIAAAFVAVATVLCAAAIARMFTRETF